MTEQLVTANSEIQPQLRTALRPIHSLLAGDLERIFCDEEQPLLARVSAAAAVGDFDRDDPARLARLLTRASPEQFALVYERIPTELPAPILAELATLAATSPSGELPTVPRVALGQQRANAAVTLLRQRRFREALAVFKMDDDPEALTQFIFRCGPRGVDVEDLLECLDLVGEVQGDRGNALAR
ncbi:MAG: hypothetical protein ACKOJF_21445, partial [Planctomycetaceae bacterium]